MKSFHEYLVRLVESQAEVALVFEEFAGSQATICAIGVSIFVNDAFVRKLKTCPFWFGPELARSLRQGDSPLLSDRELREANSHGGLLLLLAALNGGTDQELSHELGISPETVKKAWRRIYERVVVCVPDLIPLDSAAENGTSERGKEKKQRLLRYLRDHPEELRPVSRKLLRQGGTRTR